MKFLPVLMESSFKFPSEVASVVTSKSTCAFASLSKNRVKKVKSKLLIQNRFNVNLFFIIASLGVIYNA
jgi:hypothetical protein